MGAGLDCCALKHPRVAEVPRKTVLPFNAERDRLLAWRIMPNHVHVMIEPKVSLPMIVQSWKSFTGRWAVWECR